MAIACAIADDILLFHYLGSPRIKPTNQQVDIETSRGNPKVFSPFDWSIFLMTYLLAITTATLLRAVAIAAAMARATVVLLKLVAQAISGMVSSELGLDVLVTA